MAQTISELEKERAELLKAIESQAQQMSVDRSQPDDSGHTLTDWLNAAEEVMPEKKASRRTATTSKAATSAAPKAESSTAHEKAPASKASFFGVIILLSLLLTILGVLYIAYTTIDKELAEVKEVKQTNQNEAQALQDSMAQLQKSVATGGAPERFTQLEMRVMSLEQQLQTIQSQQQALLDKLEAMSSNRPQTTDAQLDVSTVATAGETAVVSDTNAGDSKDVVTVEVLDKTLKRYTSALEERIDQKLEVILQHLTLGDVKPELKNQVLLNGSTPKEGTEPTLQIDSPQGPSSNEPQAPRISQPLVKMVQPVQTPIQPEVQKPVKHMDQDVKWLLDQPDQHYVLQLASMSDRNALQTMVRQKGLADTYTVIQQRNDATRFVLLTGSFKSRAEANQASKAMKANYGISPWVRKMKDLSVRLPR